MDETRRTRAWRVADALAVLAVAGWTGYAALGTNVYSATPWPNTMVDYHLLYELSHRVVAQQTYPPNYPYPPPAVILHYATAQVPFPVSAALYLALTTAAALACWWLLLRLLRLDRRPGGTAVGLLALLPSSYYFFWDLKSQNCNVLFLLALLLGVYLLAGCRSQATAIAPPVASSRHPFTTSPRTSHGFGNDPIAQVARYRKRANRRRWVRCRASPAAASSRTAGMAIGTGWYGSRYGLTAIGARVKRLTSANIPNASPGAAARRRDADQPASARPSHAARTALSVKPAAGPWWAASQSALLCSEIRIGWLQSAWFVETARICPNQEW